MTRRPSAALAAPLALLLAGACAHIQPGTDRLAERDPLEKVNRKVWAVDMFADRHVLKPIAKGYQAVAPRPVRQGFSNFFSNLTEPWSLVNNVLQGRIGRAGRNLKRFVVNSTIGLAGFLDHASKIGIRPAYEDFGQTLARYSVNGGPYLVLPLLGPSTLRDTVGSGVAYLADPLSLGMRAIHGHIWAKRGFSAARIISARADLADTGGDAFLESSLDPYAAARSAYLQHRRAQVLNQDEGDTPTADGSVAPAAEQVPTPIGGAATSPDRPLPDGALPDSAAPLPGDDAPAAAPPAPGQPLPESAAPLPGDDAPAAAPPAPQP